jgi:hypothetical protein
VEEIIKGLWVGGDKDVPKAKERGFSRLTCAKDGPDGHRAMLKYTTMGAPKGPEYLFAQRGHWAAMNCLDIDDPLMIPDEMILDGLRFIHQQRTQNHEVLVHCNAGHSRGPSTALLYLRSIGEMPGGAGASMRKYKTLYPPFDPGVGMKAKIRELWDVVPTLFKETK